MNVEEGYDASSLNERMVRYVRLLSIVLTMNFSGRNVVASTVISMARICVPPFCGDSGVLYVCHLPSFGERRKIVF